MLIMFQTLQTIGFYGFANWAPTFLLKRGFSLLHSLEYTMLIALVSPVGPILCAWTSDRFERKWTIVTLALLVAAFGLGFGSARTPFAVVTFGTLLTLCNYWFSAAFHAFQAELFPTRIRATGVGFTYSWSRLSAAFSSLLIGAMLMHGVPAVFALLAAAMTGVAVIVATIRPRTNRGSTGRSVGSKADGRKPNFRDGATDVCEMRPTGEPAFFHAIYHESFAQGVRCAADFRLRMRRSYRSVPRCFLWVRTASICGTDLHIYGWDRWSQGRIKPPVTLGHEFCGVVGLISDEVAAVMAGDFVSAEMHVICGHCHQCRLGEAHICQNLRITGTDQDKRKRNS